MTHLIVKDRKLCVLNGRIVTSADGAPCVCDGDPDNKCSVSGSLPDFCIQITLSGCGPASCLAQDAGTGHLTEMVTMDFSASFIIPAIARGTWREYVPLTTKYIEYDRGGDGRSETILCWSFVEAYVQCDDGIWTASVFASGVVVLPPTPCEHFGPGRGGNHFIGTGLFKSERIPLGAVGQNEYNNDDFCMYPSIGGSSTATRVDDCVGVSHSAVAVKCDGSDSIAVDMLSRTSGGVSVLFQGDLYKPTSQLTTDPPVDVQWVGTECDDNGELSVYGRCDDPTNTILVDETNKPAGSVTALVGSIRYAPTGLFEEGTPTGVDWSPDPCPDVGNLWEKCDDAGALQYIRSDQPAGVGFAYFSAAGPWYSEGEHEQCRDHTQMWWRRIEDDGRSAPFYTTEARQGCNPTRTWKECRFFDDDRDAPTRPGGGTSSIPRRLPLVDLSGFNLENERRRTRQGGCCGQPSNNP